MLGSNVAFDLLANCKSIKQQQEKIVFYQKGKERNILDDFQYDIALAAAKTSYSTLGQDVTELRFVFDDIELAKNSIDSDTGETVTCLQQHAPELHAKLNKLSSSWCYLFNACITVYQCLSPQEKDPQIITAQMEKHFANAQFLLKDQHNLTLILPNLAELQQFCQHYPQCIENIMRLSSHFNNFQLTVYLQEDHHKPVLVITKNNLNFFEKIDIMQHNTAS
jgi:hypothetical protein